MKTIYLANPYGFSTIEHVQKMWSRQRKIRKGRLPSWHERLGSVL